jgi:hypothetical protein
MKMKLSQAITCGTACDDIKRYTAFPRTAAGMATYRAVGACPCGKLVPIHICAVWRGQEPFILTCRVCGETCPDCAGEFAPQEVAYLGVSGPGCPALPAVGFSADQTVLFNQLGESDSAYLC